MADYTQSFCNSGLFRSASPYRKSAVLDYSALLLFSLVSNCFHNFVTRCEALAVTGSLRFTLPKIRCLGLFGVIASFAHFKLLSQFCHSLRSFGCDGFALLHPAENPLYNFDVDSKFIKFRYNILPCYYLVICYVKASI